MAFEAAAARAAGASRRPAEATSTDAVTTLSQRMWTTVQELETLDKLTGLVNSAADTVTLRQRLALSEQRLLALRAGLDDSMRRVRVESVSGNRSVERLLSQFSEIAARLESSLTRSRQLQRSCIPRAAAVEVPAPRPRDAVGLQASSIELKSLGDVDAAIDAERRVEADLILAETREVDGMMTSVATHVAAQGEQLDAVEANVGASKDAVKEGNKELVVAAEYQTALRRKWAVVIVLILIVLAIVIVPVVVTQVPRPK